MIGLGRRGKEPCPWKTCSWLWPHLVESAGGKGSPSPNSSLPEFSGATSLCSHPVSVQLQAHSSSAYFILAFLLHWLETSVGVDSSESPVFPYAHVQGRPVKGPLPLCPSYGTLSGTKQIFICLVSFPPQNKEQDSEQKRQGSCFSL